MLNQNKPFLVATYVSMSPLVLLMAKSWGRIVALLGLFPYFGLSIGHYWGVFLIKFSVLVPLHSCWTFSQISVKIRTKSATPRSLGGDRNSQFDHHFFSWVKSKMRRGLKSFHCLETTTNGSGNYYGIIITTDTPSGTSGSGQYSVYCLQNIHWKIVNYIYWNCVF